MPLAAGCYEGQGYLFSPPVPRERIMELVAAQPPKLVMVA